MLKAVEVKGLFELFDYKIELKREGITIITGPNGYGKTTILKMMHAISTHDYLFLIDLLFEKIILYLNDKQLCIEKISDESIEIRVEGRSAIQISKDFIFEQINSLIKMPWRQMDERRWIDHRTGIVHDIESTINILEPELLGKLRVKLSGMAPFFPEVYLIREQRLLRKVPHRGKRTRHYIDDDSIEVFSETIEEYSKELLELIKDTLALYSQKAQKLDSSFPRRLFEEKREISKDDFDIRFDKVKDKLKVLSKYDLSVIMDDNHPTYKEANAKALLVYLDDTEKKLEVFTDLLERLETFTNILNKNRFIFKKLKVSKDNGFEFFAETGRRLNPTNLSSGEQQEVILLYELLFNVSPNTLVLIDEPEISLHVAWQKEFLRDLLQIIKIKGIKVIIATHSPQIINDHWDLTVDLEETLNEEIHTRK